MALSKTQQHLLSYFNLKKVIDLDLGLDILTEIQHLLNENQPVTKERFVGEVSDINKIIRKYELVIEECTDEITCAKLFILINTADNFATKKSKFCDQNTNNFLSKIIKSCILSQKGYVSETYCINLNSEIKISKITAEGVLDELLKDKWLVSRDGNISLGMRTILELGQNIKDFYPNDIKHCPFCKLMIVQGHICSNCQIKCHNACWAKYSASKSNCVCPKCNEVWNNEPSFLSNEEVEMSEDSLLPTPSASKRKRI